MKHADQVSETFNGGWTEEELLMKLVKSGMPYRRISYAIEGRTRDACIGRAHRLNYTHAKKKPKEAKPKTVVKESIRHKQQDDWNHTGTIGILELRSNDCRWPSDDKPVKYCGCQTYSDKSYCFNHYMRSISENDKQRVRKELSKNLN